MSWMSFWKRSGSLTSLLARCSAGEFGSSELWRSALTVLSLSCFGLDQLYVQTTVAWAWRTCSLWLCTLPKMTYRSRYSLLKIINESNWLFGRALRIQTPLSLPLTSKDLTTARTAEVIWVCRLPKKRLQMQLHRQPYIFFKIPVKSRFFKFLRGHARLHRYRANISWRFWESRPEAPVQRIAWKDS